MAAPDLTPKVRRMVATAQQIDALLDGGAEFRRINSEQAARLYGDLERLMDQIAYIRRELTETV